MCDWCREGTEHDPMRSSEDDDDDFNTGGTGSSE